MFCNIISKIFFPGATTYQWFCLAVFWAFKSSACSLLLIDFFLLFCGKCCSRLSCQRGLGLVVGYDPFLLELVWVLRLLGCWGKNFRVPLLLPMFLRQWLCITRGLRRLGNFFLFGVIFFPRKKWPPVVDCTLDLFINATSEFICRSMSDAKNLIFASGWVEQ